MNQDHKPITINIDTRQNMQIMDSQKKYNPAGFVGSKKFKEEYKVLSDVEQQYSELSKHPGIMSKIWEVESGNGQNQYNATSGAAGHFQFIPDTLKWMEKKMGKKINPYDFNSSAEAAGYYLNMLLKNNKGDLRQTLLDWSGAKSAKGIAETLDNYRKRGVKV